MRKVTILVIAVLAIATTAVHAGDFDATLKNKGTENAASTIAFLEKFPNIPTEDWDKLVMSPTDFLTGFGESLGELNKKYRTFSVLDATVLKEQIIPKLYSKLLDPNKMITVSRWNTVTKSWGRWTRMPYPGEEGIFFPGWEEPVLSVVCWNFGYPNGNPVITTPVLPIAPPAKKDSLPYDVRTAGANVYININNSPSNTNNNTSNPVNNPSFTAPASGGAPNFSAFTTTAAVPTTVATVPVNTTTTTTTAVPCNNCKPKVHWTEGIRNVGEGLGFAALGVAALKTAFDPADQTLNVNVDGFIGGGGFPVPNPGNGGWTTDPNGGPVNPPNNGNFNTNVPGTTGGTIIPNTDGSGSGFSWN